MPLRETAITNKEKFDITMDEYLKTIEVVKNNSKIKTIDTRVQEDMENKYILILANDEATNLLVVLVAPVLSIGKAVLFPHK